MLEAARLHYELNLSQKEVAEHLGISKATVSRLIQKARERGIVEIKLRTPQSIAHLTTFLSSELAGLLDLKEAIITPSSTNSGYLHQEMGKACADWLRTQITRPLTVGFSGGRSVSSVVPFIERSGYPVEVVQLMGGVNSGNARIHADVVARNAAAQLGGASHAIHSPAMLADSASLRAIAGNPVVAEVVQYFDKLDIAVVGIGTMQHESPLMQAGLMDAQDVLQLRRNGYIGEICGRFFDRVGEELSEGPALRTLSITLQQLRRTPAVCAVAAGATKIEAIAASIDGGYVDVLVTDTDTAQALVELKGGERRRDERVAADIQELGGRQTAKPD
jgi:DNA-binding transcriptional regulator LsrR (DeoR family)